ncbi:MAG: AAA family ATPase [Methylococcales bacterium]|nr:AAA family ATPase [Methylococcales bacterium]
MNSSKNITEKTPPSAYFGSLTITDVKCFKGEQTIDLSDGNGQPAMWTVILGNNNTGKTTLLRCLANLEPVVDEHQEEHSYVPKLYTKWRSPQGIGYLNAQIQCEWIGIKDSWLFYVGKHRETNSFVLSYPHLPFETIGNAIIYGYGTSRKMGNTSLTETENQDNTASLFDSSVVLTNVEEWLLQLDYVIKSNPNENATSSAKSMLQKILKVITSGLLPGVNNFSFVTDFVNGRAKNFVTAQMDYGDIPLRELGEGYQVTLAWILDLAKKMFIRYKDSENPLHEPAIVLVDEIDLHLHPEWQRKIISFLKTQFPRTQFIVTTHSPLIVQSAEDINLVLLKKEENHVVIEQPKLKTYRGWTVEEILSELMGLDDKTLSDDYLKLMQQFDEALDEDDYKKAKNAYDELDKILHPTSHQRKLLRIQMSSLMPE